MEIGVLPAYRFIFNWGHGALTYNPSGLTPQAVGEFKTLAEALDTIRDLESIGICGFDS